MVNPGTTSQVIIPAGKYTLSDTIVQGDANLVAGNIKKGVSIFGVSGTYVGDTTKATFEVNEDQSSYPYKIEIVASTDGRVESGDVVGEIPQADFYYEDNGGFGCDIFVGSTGACFERDVPLTIPYYEGNVMLQDVQNNTDSFNVSVYADGSGEGYIPPSESYMIGSSDILKSDLASLESDCKPENIKKGATILGVAGTLDGLDPTQWDTWVINEDLTFMYFQGDPAPVYTCPIILFDGRVASALNAYTYDTGSVTGVALYFYLNKTTTIEAYSAEDSSGTWTDQRYRTIKVPAFIKTYPNESQYTGGGYGSMYAFLQEYATLST